MVHAFFDLCQSRRIALIIDETYRDFLHPSRVPNHDLFSLPHWEGTLISLYSFSKSYAIPGHRVGAIIASSLLIEQQVVKVLDALLVCAPVPPQKVLEWAIHDPQQREWRAARRDELVGRGKLFTQVVNAVNARIVEERGHEHAASWPGWQIDGLGAYYAYLRHPYARDGADAESVAKGLGQRVGVSVLPASFFGEGQVLDKRKGQRVSRTKTEPDHQHLRVSIANVFDDSIRALEDRFVSFDRMMR